MNSLIYLIFALPLVIYLLNLSLGLLMRAFVKSAMIEKNYDFQPRVSVLMPCFNEGGHVLKTIGSILSNDYPAGKIEVIAIDDCSADDTYNHLEKAAKKWPANVKVSKNAVNSGKHHTLISALARSSGEILICIDSDTIFDRNAIKELTACFADHTIGAVGGRVGVSNTRENIFTQGQTFFYYWVFNITKMIENWARNITCISGAMFAVRREHFEAIQEQVKQRNWFGIGVRDGEDRYMTRLILLKGVKTYVNIDAQCWTAVPNNFKQLFMQQLRWRRGSLRNLFWTLRTFRRNLKVLHPLIMINILMPGTLVCLWPLMYIYAATSGWLLENLFLAIQIHFGVNIVMGILFNMHVRKRNPEQMVNPLSTGLLALWFIVDSFFISLAALCTFDIGEWGTRGTSTQKAA